MGGSTDTQGSSTALKNANTAWNTYNQNYGDWKSQYDDYRNKADQAWGEGIKTANQQLAQGAAGAQNQSQLASRQAGLSKGQAAMNAAGAANSMYQNNYVGAVQGATQQRLGAAQTQQQNAMEGMNAAQQGQMGALQTQAQVGASQKSQWDKNMGTAGVVGGFLSSDENAKQDIEKTDWKDNFLKRLTALGGV